MKEKATDQIMRCYYFQEWWELNAPVNLWTRCDTPVVQVWTTQSETLSLGLISTAVTAVMVLSSLYFSSPFYKMRIAVVHTDFTRPLWGIRKLI